MASGTQQAREQIDVHTKIRSLINPQLREIHETIQGTLSMGDLAVYVGQPMQDAMEKLARFCYEADQELIQKLTEALEAADKLDGFHANCTECEGLEQPEACVDCFPLADDARLKRRAALKSAQESQR